MLAQLKLYPFTEPHRGSVLSKVPRIGTWAPGGFGSSDLIEFFGDGFGGCHAHGAIDIEMSDQANQVVA